MIVKLGDRLYSNGDCILTFLSFVGGTRGLLESASSLKNEAGGRRCRVGDDAANEPEAYAIKGV